MEVKNSINSKIDWLGCCKIPVGNHTFNEESLYITVKHSDNETVEQARLHWFDMMRRFLDEVYKEAEMCDQGNILSVFKKWNVHAVDMDKVKRINIDEPGNF